MEFDCIFGQIARVAYSGFCNLLYVRVIEIYSKNGAPFDSLDDLNAVASLGYVDLWGDS